MVLLDNLTCNYLKIINCKIYGDFKITRSVFQEGNVYFNNCCFNNFYLTHNEFETRLFVDRLYFARNIDIASSYFNIFHVHKYNFVKLINNKFSNYSKKTKVNAIRLELSGNGRKRKSLSISKRQQS